MDWEALFREREKTQAEILRPLASFAAQVTAVFESEGHSRREAHEWSLMIGREAVRAQNESTG